MGTRFLLIAALVAMTATVSGCKEDKDEAASPDCVNQATKYDPSVCPRADTGITRSKPKTWSLDGGNK